MPRLLPLRPAHNPARAYGFAGVVLSLEDLSSAVFLRYLDREHGGGRWQARKVITIAAEPADPTRLPPILQGLGAVPPLVTDINLSVDDRFLYVSCWGTGELRQYDVSDPFNPALLATARLGGIVRRTAHPKRPTRALSGGPRTVEVSRDGRQVYLTNSPYSSWEAQFYPDGVQGWMAKLDVGADGGLTFDRDFLVELEDEPHPNERRLETGDTSSDFFSYS